MVLPENDKRTMICADPMFTITKLTERIEELKEELSFWVSQYGCNCKHPRCSLCKVTKDSKILLGES